jgi:hypothetical protein
MSVRARKRPQSPLPDWKGVVLASRFWMRLPLRPHDSGWPAVEAASSATERLNAQAGSQNPEFQTEAAEPADILVVDRRPAEVDSAPAASSLVHMAGKEADR